MQIVSRADLRHVDSMAGGVLAGRRIMIVEDDFLIGHDLRRIVEQAGGTVFGPVDSELRALELAAAQQIHGAFLDVRLHRTDSSNIARHLKASQVPFIVVSGYAHDSIPAEMQTGPYMGKPVMHAPLLELASRTFRAP
jgi:two-component SAPR family response regulator